MSYCREEGEGGKDKIIFLTKEDYNKPSTAVLEEEEEEPGLILDNGDINWSCPCLGGMATGPCGLEFREAFSCFHYSQEEMKGSDCYDQFKKMQDCMAQYPDLYDSDSKEGATDTPSQPTGGAEEGEVAPPVDNLPDNGPGRTDMNHTGLAGTAS